LPFAEEKSARSANACLGQKKRGLDRAPEVMLWPGLCSEERRDAD
jgi:hypothetical protein